MVRYHSYTFFTHNLTHFTEIRKNRKAAELRTHISAETEAAARFSKQG